MDVAYILEVLNLAFWISMHLVLESFYALLEEVISVTGGN